MTNWVITQNNRFKAAVPVASISNLISDWGADANPDWFESDGGFMPFENYDKIWAMSPLKYVANCKTPTLFIHGAWDFCVNVGAGRGDVHRPQKAGRRFRPGHLPQRRARAHPTRARHGLSSTGAGLV